MGFRNAGAIAHHSSCHGEFPQRRDRGQCITSRQCNDLFRVADQEWISDNVESFDPLLCERCEGRLQLALCTGMDDNQLLSERLRCRLRIFQSRVGRREGRIDKRADERSFRQELVQQFKPLCLQRAEEEGYAREIAAWLVKTLHQAKVNRIASRDEDDWSGRGRRHGGPGRGDSTACCNDHRHLAANQIRRQRWKLIIVTQRPAKIDLHILSIEIAEFAQAALERYYVSDGIFWRPAAEKSDHRHRRLLRACRERPRGCRAAEQRDELASSSIEHGLLPGTRCASLPQAQDAPEAPAGPWRRPEMF